MQVVEIPPAWYSKVVQTGAMLTAPNIGCAAMPFTGVRDYLEYTVRQRRPDGRILDYAERPDLVAQANTRNPLPQLPATPQMRSLVPRGCPGPGRLEPEWL